MWKTCLAEEAQIAVVAEEAHTEAILFGVNAIQCEMFLGNKNEKLDIIWWLEEVFIGRKRIWAYLEG